MGAELATGQVRKCFGQNKKKHTPFCRRRCRHASAKIFFGEHQNYEQQKNLIKSNAHARVFIAGIKDWVFDICPQHHVVLVKR